MGLGRLNPGCNDSCDDGCGFFCHGRKSAVIRISGGIGCLAEVNGDYIVPRFFAANTGEPGSPFIPTAPKQACGYSGFVGQNTTVPTDRVSFESFDNVCSGGIVHTEAFFDGTVSTQKIPFETFQLEYIGNEGGRLRFTTHARFILCPFFGPDFPNCYVYPHDFLDTSVSTGRPFTWTWNWPFGAGGNVGFASGISAFGQLVTIDELMAEVYVD